MNILEIIVVGFIAAVALDVAIDWLGDVVADLIRKIRDAKRDA